MSKRNMATSKTKYAIWGLALILIMACVPTIAAPPAVPTTDPNAISTYIAQTANAASSQTAVALPTFTPTATFTPTPRNTDTPEPTATATVIFVFFSPTAIVPTTSNESYACEVMSTTPANGTSFNSRQSFDTVWQVKNVGKKEWDRNTVDYAYNSGDKFHKVAGYDLTANVARGDATLLNVAMQAPKNPGTYTTTWALRAGSATFCTMTLSITVK